MQRTCFPLRCPRIGFAFTAVLALATLPITATAACTVKGGGTSPMLGYAGNHVGEKNLLAAPTVAAHLERLPPHVRQHLDRNLDVAGEINLIGCHLVLSGNAPHMAARKTRSWT